MTDSKILCAVDLTQDSHEVLRVARAEAERTDSALEIVHVQRGIHSPAMPSAMMLPTGPLPRQNTQEQIERLNRLSRPTPTRPEVATLLPSEGSTGRTLLNYADEANVDRIVIGHHARTGIVRWLFGSTSERVVRDAQLPVLVVPLAQVAADPLETLADGRDRVRAASEASFPASDPPPIAPGVA